MPLLDHFHPPFSSTRHWESLHTQWSGSIANLLNNKVLPLGYFAEAQVHIGSRVEIDVATFEQPANGASQHGGTGPAESGASTATASARVWSPPSPDMEIPAVFPDNIEVLVFETEGGPNLVAAVELISPSNKDRPETRRAFASKCSSYLQQGIGLVLVDVVTSRQANLHNELVEVIQAGAQFSMPAASIYAVAYRPTRSADSETIQVWSAQLALGEPLPLMPLALDKGVCVPLELEAAYEEACQRSRLT